MHPSHDDPPGRRSRGGPRRRAAGRFTIGLTLPSGTTRTTLSELQFLVTSDARLSRVGLDPIDQATRLEVLRATAEIYAFFHERDVVVGDISPKNVLWARDPGAVHLLELGPRSGSRASCRRWSSSTADREPTVLRSHPEPSVRCVQAQAARPAGPVEERDCDRSGAGESATRRRRDVDAPADARSRTQRPALGGGVGPLPLVWLSAFSDRTARRRSHGCRRSMCLRPQYSSSTWTSQCRWSDWGRSAPVAADSVPRFPISPRR